MSIISTRVLHKLNETGNNGIRGFTTRKKQPQNKIQQQIMTDSSRPDLYFFCQKKLAKFGIAFSPWEPTKRNPGSATVIITVQEVYLPYN